MHGEEPCRVYIEEYLLLCAGRVGILLGPAARLSFEAGGSEWHFVGDRIVFAKLLTVDQELLHAVGVYLPTNA
eukprot:7665331-Pyramimonas_sp.AAC.1